MSPLQIALLSLAIGVAPIACSLLASAIAHLCKAKLSAAEVTPCYVFGYDIGGLLSTMFMLHWFAIFTLPLMFIGWLYALYKVFF